MYFKRFQKIINMLFSLRKNKYIRQYKEKLFNSTSTIFRYTYLNNK